MKIKSKIAGLIVATTVLAAAGPSWAMHHHRHHHYVGYMGSGWHMVPKSSGIPHAMTWQEYASGVYTQPIVGRGMLFMK